MPIIISGVPLVGSNLEIKYSGDSTFIEKYEMYSGFSEGLLKLVKSGSSPFYVPSNLDLLLKAKVYLKNGDVEESNIVQVIKSQTDYYTEARIETVGNGLALTDVLNKNSNCSKVVSDVKRISQSIFIILSTSLAEIPMLDILGSTLPYHLFKEVTDNTIEQLRRTIIDTLNSQEPRISVTSVDVCIPS